MKSRLASVFIAAAFSAASVSADFEARDAGRPGAVLDFAAGARALAMGEAYTAVVEDASAVYWNPAALRLIEQNNLVTMFSTLPESTSFSFASFAYPMRRYGALGFGIADLRSSGFTRRDADGNDAGGFDVADTAFLFSHGFSPIDRWMAGSTLKVIRQDVADNDDFAFGLDVGGMYRATPQWRLGVSLQNVIAPTFSLDTSEESYDRGARIGAMYEPIRRVSLAADVGLFENQSAALAIGGDFRVTDLLSLRAGLNRSEFSAGFGMQFGDWNLDYAFATAFFNKAVREIGNTHNVGFRVSFGRARTSVEELAALRRQAEQYLLSFQKKMAENDAGPVGETEFLVEATKNALKRDAFDEPVDEFAARGYVAYFSGDLDESAALFEKALAFKPKEKHLQLARTRAMKGLDEERQRQFVESEIRQAKENFEKGRYVDAFAHFEKVRQADPENQVAQTYLVKTLTILERRSSNPGAAISLKKIDDAVAASMDHYKEGLTLYKSGKLESASKEFEKALESAGGNYLARESLKQVLREMQDRMYRY